MRAQTGDWPSPLMLLLYVITKTSCHQVSTGCRSLSRALTFVTACFVIFIQFGIDIRTMALICLIFLMMVKRSGLSTQSTFMNRLDLTKISHLV